MICDCMNEDSTHDYFCLSKQLDKAKSSLAIAVEALETCLGAADSDYVTDIAEKALKTIKEASK